MTIEEKEKEIAFLRDQVCQLRSQVTILQKQFHAPSKKPHDTLKEKLYILWIQWGRVRSANQMKMLGIFLSASTVRSILNRAKPTDPEPAKSAENTPPATDRNGCRIPAWFLNHLWSVDLTEVYGKSGSSLPSTISPARSSR